MRGRSWTACLAALAGCLSSPPGGSGGDPDAAPAADAEPVPCLPRQEFPSFEDEFDDAMVLWSEEVFEEPPGSPIDAVSQDSKLVVELVDTAGHMLWLKTRAIDLSGVRLTLEMVEVPNPDVIGARAWFAILPYDLAENAVQIMYLEDRLETPSGEIDFDPEADRWWQMRVTESEIVVETSPDGVAWNQIDAVALPAGIDTANFEVGTKSDTDEPGAGRLVIDHLNLPPNRCE